MCMYISQTRTCIRTETDSELAHATCMPLKIRCFFGPHLAMSTRSKPFSLKFFNHSWMFFRAMPNFLSASGTLWCLAYIPTSCIDLYRFRGSEGSVDLVLCTKLKYSVMEAISLTLSTHPLVDVRIRQHLKICPNSKGACKWNWEFTMFVRGRLDWGGAYIWNFMAILIPRMPYSTKYYCLLAYNPHPFYHQ